MIYNGQKKTILKNSKEKSSAEISCKKHNIRNCWECSPGEALKAHLGQNLSKNIVEIYDSIAEKDMCY